jgi:hypothetical protein
MARWVEWPWTTTLTKFLMGIKMSVQLRIASLAVLLDKASSTVKSCVTTESSRFETLHGPRDVYGDPRLSDGEQDSKNYGKR